MLSRGLASYLSCFFFSINKFLLAFFFSFLQKSGFFVCVISENGSSPIGKQECLEN